MPTACPAKTWLRLIFSGPRQIRPQGKVEGCASAAENAHPCWPAVANHHHQQQHHHHDLFRRFCLCSLRCAPFCPVPSWPASAYNGGTCLPTTSKAPQRKVHFTKADELKDEKGARTAHDCGLDDARPSEPSGHSNRFKRVHGARSFSSHPIPELKAQEDIPPRTLTPRPTLRKQSYAIERTSQSLRAERPCKGS
jgi:hypothetical protein